MPILRKDLVGIENNNGKRNCMCYLFSISGDVAISFVSFIIKIYISIPFSQIEFNEMKGRKGNPVGSLCALTTMTMTTQLLEIYFHCWTVCPS